MHSFLLKIGQHKLCRIKIRAEHGTHRSFRLVAGWSTSTIRVIIECGILHESRKNKQETDSDEKVHCCDV